MVFTRNTRLLPPVCVSTSDPTEMNSRCSVSSCNSDITRSDYVVCEVQASAYIINPQTLKNVLMVLSNSQVMLLSPSHCASCEVYLRKNPGQSRLGVGWEGVWLVHLCRLAGRRTREECTHTHGSGRVALGVLPAGSTFEDVCVFVIQ